MRKDVVVIIGVGGMGLAIARRMGSGRAVLLADFNEETLTGAAGALLAEGHDVTAQQVDVSAAESVAALAKTADGLGRVTALAHTAGLSPVQAPAEAILRVDLLGAALVLDAFTPVVAPGGAAVVIASMAGHLAAALPPEQERALASTPAAELLALPFLGPDVVRDPGTAYGVAKRANTVRVQMAAATWGERGARVNSISPGIVSTPMGAQELAGQSGGYIRAMTEKSGVRRLGTPDDIAAAAQFLLSDQATFITGADLLVDGGVVAAVRSGQL
ncbi:SDR family oxidoreductase [Amycolatopsis sp. K13G38]|uniref:SDR family oxidoreductase n=1 Tax=Amycolatopsis acididurans TaxID=2724524 RepID=A0ABX1J1N2_9PSEU|nr:SDR family oxidoreductase [Amycolatopsis acididurans]NKQ52884.1 SDR family oxidoreductase [Amycolatopsis acididurans]